MESTSGRTLTKDAVEKCLHLIKRIQDQRLCSQEEYKASRILTQWLSHLDLSDSSDTDDTLDAPSRALLADYRSFKRPSRKRLANGLGDLMGSSPVTRNSLYLKHQMKDGQEQLIAELEKLTDWMGFNIFAVRDLSEGFPLTTVAATLVDRFDLYSKLDIDRIKLINFLKDVERAYKENPYHNSTHAADVVQSLGCILINDSLSEQLTEMELLAMIIAAAVHDVGHPGVSNDFLIKTAAETALQYNDIHVNENMHAALAFKIFLKPQNNFLSHLQEGYVTFFRRTVISIVLATDMAGHEELVQDFKQQISLHGPQLTLWHPDKRVTGLQMCVHCADIANPAKPVAYCTQWTDRVLQEFFAQGDIEKRKGLPISPQCDREQVNCGKSQIIFLDRVVRPCYETLSLLAPKSSAIALKCMDQAKEYWELIQQRPQTNQLCVTSPQ